MDRARAVSPSEERLRGFGFVFRRVIGQGRIQAMQRCWIYEGLRRGDGDAPRGPKTISSPGSMRCRLTRICSRRRCFGRNRRRELADCSEGEP
jgi:hypothetical protein